MMSAPITLPTRLKRPPVSAVPPSVTARIASNSSSWPALLPSALFTFELINRPATPAHTPQNAYAPMTSRRAWMPATRAAVGLMPTAWMNRPSAVRVIARYSSANTAATMNSENGSPSR